MIPLAVHNEREARSAESEYLEPMVKDQFIYDLTYHTPARQAFIEWLGDQSIALFTDLLECREGRSELSIAEILDRKKLEFTNYMLREHGYQTIARDYGLSTDDED